MDKCFNQFTSKEIGNFYKIFIISFYKIVNVISLTYFKDINFLITLEKKKNYQKAHTPSRKLYGYADMPKSFLLKTQHYYYKIFIYTRS